MTTADEARDQLLALVDTMRLEDLALAARHEYDEEAAVPPAGSVGHAFLESARQTYVEWVRLAGRFPVGDDEIADTATRWPRQEPPARLAQAYVDLALYYSAHAQAGLDLSAAGLIRVLDSVADRISVTLTEQYAPHV